MAYFDKITDLRLSLEQERDQLGERIQIINKQIDTLRRYEDLEIEKQSSGASPPVDKKTSKPPPPKKKVVKRKKLVPAAKILDRKLGKKPKPPAPKPVVSKSPKKTITKSVSDQAPTQCGNGKEELRDDSNAQKIVSVLEDRAPHWMTHVGIMEGAVGMGLKIPKTFQAIIHQECAQLRKGRYKIPGLEWKATGRRMEYRIVKKTKVVNDN